MNQSHKLVRSVGVLVVTGCVTSGLASDYVQPAYLKNRLKYVKFADPKGSLPGKVTNNIRT